MKDQTDKNFEALYWLGSRKQFCCFIPKKNGRGYLKAAFGGHHINKVYQEWDDIKPNGVNDICDIDGYLQIDITLNHFDDGYDELIEDIKKSLIEVFPDQITSWREIHGNEFIKVSTGK